jgi:hypothetical protein
MPTPNPPKPSSYPSPYLQSLGLPISIAVEDLGQRAVVERFPPEGPSADVVFKCRYADRYAVIKGLRGGVIQTGKKFQYVPAARYPPSPNLVCTSIGEITGIRPWTDANGWLQYDEALVPATFTVPTWDAIDAQAVSDPSGIPMTTTKFKGSGEVFEPPVGSFFYTAGASSGKKVSGSSVGIIRPRTEISMTRHGIPYPYLDGPLWIEGCVNDTPVLFADREFPRGCLLMASFDMDPVPDPSTGDKAWDYTFTLLGNDVREWNEFMDPAGEYVLINTAADGSGEYVFPYENFDLLFSDDFQAPPGD